MQLMRYKAVLPADLAPFLTDDAWTAMQKLDGMRVALEVNHAQVIVHGAAKSTAIAKTIAAITLFGHKMQDDGYEFMLEGEVVDGVWHVFDVNHFSHNASPSDFGYVPTQLLPERPWAERLYKLQMLGERLVILDSLSAPWIPATPLADFITVVRVEQTTAGKQALWAEVQAAGSEGVIIKRLDSKVSYDGKRVDDVLKCKITHTVDCVVLERGPGNGRNGKGNWMKLGVHVDSVLTEVGRCSTIGKPVAAPGEVVEVKYLYAGAGSRLVQPTHLRNRDDRVASSCDNSQLVFVNKSVLA